MFFKSCITPLFIGPVFKGPICERLSFVGSFHVASRKLPAGRAIYTTYAAPIFHADGLQAANDGGRPLARWRRDPASGRLECRWLVPGTGDAGIGEEPPPGACALPALIGAASGLFRGAVRSGRTEVRHDLHLPPPPAFPRDRRAAPRARSVQCP
ncbi:hypothetical protein [Pseudomonas sp. CGJS7]|uniref:hypothetical protein n=1 Tax=Pseudomonas sp. CGJS7 TaxID=3109348 RepID=UPI0030086941